MFPTELKLTSLGHCYVHLPDILLRKIVNLKLGSVLSIRSVQRDIELQVLWDGQVTSGGHVELDLHFAQANSFQDELVIVSWLKDVEPQDCSTCRVELVEASDYSIISEHLEANVLDTCKLVNEGLVIPIWLSKHVRVLVKVVNVSPQPNCALLTKWTEMQYQHSLEKVPQAKKQAIEENEEGIRDPIPVVSCSLGVNYKPKFNLGSVLICGDRGSGKTFFLKTILDNYKKYNSELLDCKQLRGKRPESIKKRFNELLEVAIEKQPSIIALDGIDSFISGDPKHDDERGTEIIYKKRLVDAFCYLIKQLERPRNGKVQKVIILATCRSLNSIDLRVSKPKGRVYFTEIINLKRPNLQERIDIIRNILKQHNQVQISMDENELRSIAERVDTFMPIDLRRLVERGIISACGRSSFGFNTDGVKIHLEDFETALNNYTPSNLRGVALQPKTSRTFADVGGMKKIKESLMKTILLQIRYPKLFKKCPIKPQSSILLYGPPGCGKTLIAEALTNQNGINSICVRGPELLSKYIGASEAAVRDLFKRAELAKPCVIFFDEFESLVSKRGADSTGVTDRIVNQFLTIMDGVEKLSSNVFILAATSRPDMIDPAMLRPGRLDKHIYCPVPNQEEREEILKVLSKKINFEDPNSFSFTEWSHKLEGFTGADIQAFLYSVQLKALHECLGPPGNIPGGYNKSEQAPKDLSQIRNKRIENEELAIKIREVHLRDSFAEMNQEVSARYEKLLNQYPASIRKVNEQVAVRATLA